MNSIPLSTLGRVGRFGERLGGRLGRLTVPRRSPRSPVGRTMPFHDMDILPSRDSGGGPRVLVLSASVGAGHIRAAQAIETALHASRPDVAVTHVDVLDLTNAPFRSVYGKGYFKLVDWSPNMVRALFDALDVPQVGTRKQRLRLAFERINFRRLIRLLFSQRWDLVVCTHFLPAGIISNLRLAGKCHLPMQTVVTDFDVHGLWVTEACDHYYVASPHTAQLLHAKGVADSRISVTGIPIDPVFETSPNLVELRTRHQLLNSRPTILQMAGGFGIGSVEQIYTQLRDIPFPLNIVTVTGKNTDALQRLQALGPHPMHHCKVLGFTRQVDELMALADVVVSKPGGLTTSESLARGCPMAIVEPIPGQEERNSDFLLEHQCGVRVSDLGALGARLAGLLNDPRRLADMKANARRQGRPDAARTVAMSIDQVLA